MKRSVLFAVTSIWSVLLPAHLLAQSVPLAVQEARQSIFRVVILAGDQGSSGTAWAVNENTLITNAHIVNAIEELEAATGEEATVFVVNQTGRRFGVIDYDAFDAVDVATLHVATDNLRPLMIFDGEVPIDTPIWNLGYPGVADFAGTAMAAQISSGNAQEFLDVTDPEFGVFRALRHDAASGPGSSGSPIFNECGHVIGLHFAGLSDDQGAGLSGASRLAISSEALIEYMGVESRSTRFESAPSCAGSSTGTIATIVGALTVLGLLLGAVFLLRKPKRPTPVENNSASTNQEPAATTVPSTLILSGRTDDGPFEIQAPLAPDSRVIQIGRSDDPARGNDLILAFSSVSSVHASIEQMGVNFRITDLGSSNGTFVRGDRIEPNQPVPIIMGEKIKIADVTVEVGFK